MKVLFLAEPSSAHTIKWANELINQGIKLHIFGLGNYNASQYDQRITIHSMALPDDIVTQDNGAFAKLIYIKAIPLVKKLINEIKPDILHAHYATSYGMLAAFSGFHPSVLSVWGSDIFAFVKKSFLHKWLVTRNMKKADHLCSTSNFMAQEIKQYVDKPVTVIPFGIKPELFPVRKTYTNEGTITIGTVKKLEPLYGIEYLIRAFARVIRQTDNRNIRLLIVGGGYLKQDLENLTEELKINQYVTFTGFVDYNKVLEYHSQMDIEIIPSLEESFGVSALEAMACGNPLICSAVGGLQEIVTHNKNGILVPPKDEHAFAEQMISLLENPELRKKLGTEARRHVIEKYNLAENTEQTITIYKALLNT